tara:strand:- start:231 stop:455 length:225 start_codon:yes stop_codon:yes gene_type:complete
MVEFDCEVNINGMVVNSGDLIHADVHGAVIIPSNAVTEIIETAEEIAKREDRIISLCRDKNFSVDQLKKIWGGE